MASYRYTTKGHIITITRNGEQKTYTIPIENYVRLLCGHIHEFSPKELTAMGIPQSITIEERHNRIAAELSGGIHIGYSFYYINGHLDDGPATRIWIELDEEAEQLRKDLIGMD